MYYLVIDPLFDKKVSRSTLISGVGKLPKNLLFPSNLQLVKYDDNELELFEL